LADQAVLLEDLAAQDSVTRRPADNPPTSSGVRKAAVRVGGAVVVLAAGAPVVEAAPVDSVVVAPAVDSVDAAAAPVVVEAVRVEPVVVQEVVLADDRV